MQHRSKWIKLELPNVLAQKHRRDLHAMAVYIYTNKHINMSTSVKYVTLHVLMTADTKMSFFWVVVQCNLVQVH
jgi:hypothetical protein